MAGTAAYADAKEMWARAQWEPDDAAKKELAHTMVAAFDAMLTADAGAAAGAMTKVQRAGVHNIRGQCYAMLGDGAETLNLARRDYSRALKLNGKMGQARLNLAAANKAMRSRDLAAKNAKAEQDKLKYCCWRVPRPTRGPFKAKPKEQDFGGPAFAKIQQKTHLLKSSLALTSVVVGGEPSSGEPASKQPPAISWAWPDEENGGSSSKKHAKHAEVDKDIMLAIESAKLQSA